MNMRRSEQNMDTSELSFKYNYLLKRLKIKALWSKRKKEEHRVVKNDVSRNKNNHQEVDDRKIFAEGSFSWRRSEEER